MGTRYSKLTKEETGKGSGFVWIMSGKTAYVSCYYRPPTPDKPDSFEEHLDELEDPLQNVQGNIIPAGDFNSIALEWGSAETNSRR